MKNADQQAYVTIGKIGPAYGVNGWLKIRAYTEDNMDIFKYQPWYLSAANHGWERITVEEGRAHGKGLVVKLAGFDTPEAARLLTGKFIGIDRSQLPALDQNEYYWSDLEGLTVINQNGEILGKVSYLIETGSNDVMVVKGEKEHAVPYLPGSVVTKVDLAKQEIHVDWELI